MHISYVAVQRPGFRCAPMLKERLASQNLPGFFKIKLLAPASCASCRVPRRTRDTEPLKQLLALSRDILVLSYAEPVMADGYTESIMTPKGDTEVRFKTAPRTGRGRGAPGLPTGLALFEPEHVVPPLSPKSSGERQRRACLSDSVPPQENNNN